MQLTESEKKSITKILKRNNRFAWRDPVIEKAITIINQIRDGTISINDWIVPGILTYEDYCYQTYLNEFI